MSLKFLTSELPTTIVRQRMGQLSAHILIALIALVVIGGATRVMEAGLACPDWPLCYGSFFPKGKMNIQVFLEWFHRLDAFFVGITISVQFFCAFAYKSLLPKWFPLASGLVLLLVLLQGGLGALTVFQLLPSVIVMAHLLMALTLVALMSGLSRLLLHPNGIDTPLWWKMLSGISLGSVFTQSVLGARMATTWSAQRCISQSINCSWLDLHRFSAILVSLSIILFVSVSFYRGGWFRSQWPLMVSVLFLLSLQIMLGVFSIQFQLNEPLLMIAHQLVAALLVAFLSALSFSKPTPPALALSKTLEYPVVEVCNG